MKNLPTDLLRTFVTVVDQGGVTRASEIMGRSQPAISLQLKRLEELVEAPLLERDGRSLRLTGEGEVLLRYAREILALSDEAFSRLARPALEGTVRLGIPNEYASSFLPQILGKFAQSHPNVAVEVVCDLSTNLLASHERNELDLVFALHADSSTDDSEEGWAEELVWVTSPEHRCHTRTPLPLIVAPRGCVYRGRIMQVLEEARMPWRVLYSSRSFGGIRAGVLAGLGVTVLARSVVPHGLRRLKPGRELPALPPVRVQLHYDRDRPGAAVRELADYMAANLRERRPAARRTA